MTLSKYLDYRKWVLSKPYRLPLLKFFYKLLPAFVYLLYPLYRYEDIEPNAPVGINTSVNSDQPINVHLLRLPFVFEDDVESTKVKLVKVINDIFDLRY